MDMSGYVLSRVLSIPERQFRRTVSALQGPGVLSFALADINSLLSRLTAYELREAVATPPDVELSPYLGNYVAAMVESACARRAIPVPAWTSKIAPLEEPAFGSPLHSLRLHLLRHSPVPFRRRNIFIDASLGDGV
jgi:hypothetical protein